MSALEQGVLVVEAYANSEREVSSAIQSAVSEAVFTLNAEGKKVINIIAGPSVNYIVGVNHLTYILWEMNNGNIDYSSSQASNVKPANAVNNSQAQVSKTETVVSQPSAKANIVSKNGLYDVIMINCGQKKIAVVTVIRRLFRLGLAEAKNLAERENKSIRTGLSLGEAQRISNALKEAGAVVEIRPQQ